MTTSIRILYILLFAISSAIFADTDLLEPIKLQGGVGHDHLDAMAISGTGAVAAAYRDRGVYFWQGQSQFSHRHLTRKSVKVLALNDQQQALVGYKEKNQISLLLLKSASMKNNAGEATILEAEIGKARGQILDIKFGVDDAEFFVLSGVSSFTETAVWLEKWSINNPTRLLVRKINPNTRSISLSADRSKVITSSYDTNNSDDNNEFSLYEATTLDEIARIRTENSAKVFALLSPRSEEIGYLSGFSDFIVLRNDKPAQTLRVAEEFGGVDALSFFGNSDTIAVADGKKRTVRFYDLTSEVVGEPTAYIWPFWGGHYNQTIFAPNGYMASWSKNHGLSLWQLRAPATTPYSQLVTLPEYKSLKAPPGQPVGSQEDLNCVLAGNKLTITNTSGMRCWGPIYWFINQPSDANELLDHGVSEGELAVGNSMTISLESEFNDASCSASFYVRRHNAP